jgi:hypothetical protein
MTYHGLTVFHKLRFSPCLYYTGRFEKLGRTYTMCSGLRENNSSSYEGGPQMNSERVTTKCVY